MVEGGRMRKKVVLILAFSLTGVVLVGAYLAAKFSVSAMPDPGRFETYAANKAKNWFVYCESRAAR